MKCETGKGHRTRRQRTACSRTFLRVICSDLCELPNIIQLQVASSVHFFVHCCVCGVQQKKKHGGVSCVEDRLRRGLCRRSTALRAVSKIGCTARISRTGKRRTTLLRPSIGNALRTAQNNLKCQIACILYTVGVSSDRVMNVYQTFSRLLPTSDPRWSPAGEEFAYCCSSQKT